MSCYPVHPTFHHHGAVWLRDTPGHHDRLGPVWPVLLWWLRLYPILVIAGTVLQTDAVPYHHDHGAAAWLHTDGGWAVCLRRAGLCVAQAGHGSMQLCRSPPAEDEDGDRVFLSEWLHGRYGNDPTSVSDISSKPGDHRYTTYFEFIV